MSDFYVFDPEAVASKEFTPDYARSRAEGWGMVSVDLAAIVTVDDTDYAPGHLGLIEVAVRPGRYAIVRLDDE